MKDKIGQWDNPPVSPKEMDAIECLHERADEDFMFFADSVWATTAHEHRRLLLKQLDYTAGVIVSLQLELARLKEELA